MQNHWTKEELEVYINFCKLNNIKYDSIWLNLEDEEREESLSRIHQLMLKIDKPVKIFLDSQYIKTIRYSLIDFVQDEFPDKILTWIPDNFESRKTMVEFIEKILSRKFKIINLNIMKFNIY
ncbi:MAG: hypothetical protein R6V23_04430 [Bacteroidales bacterium]